MNFTLIRNYTIVAISCLLIGRYVLQPEPKTITKVVTKEVEKKQEKKDEKKVVKSTKTKKPDGTITTETTVTIDTQTKTSTEKKVESEVSQSKGKGVTLGLLAVKELDSLQQTHAEAIATVPFFGNLSIATSINTKKQIGLGLALEF